MKNRTHKQLAGKRILIVEDEAILALNYAELLRSVGAEIVAISRSADEAIDRVRQNDIDVVVLDFVLEDENSGRLQTALKAKGIPYVVVSAYPRPLIRTGGEDEILSKPVSPDVLCSSVADACRRYDPRSLER